MKIILICLCFNFLSSASVPVPKWDKCSRPQSGSWSFGQGPKRCLINEDRASSLRSLYPDLIYNRDNNSTDETRRYVNALNIFLTKTIVESQYSFPSAKDRAEFMRAFKALIHQESYWSHYTTDSSEKLYIMRGDFGHGYGLTQIDDRWHNPIVVSGGAIDLNTNLLYTFKTYHRYWTSVKSLWCVRASSYEQRSRAAYSAYNGGPDDACRFRNPFSKWRRNDQGFKAKYEQQAWKKYL